MAQHIDFEHELYKAFGQVKDFTLGMQIAKLFYDMGKNSQEPVSEKKCMFTKDSYTDEDRKVLCEDCKEKCEYSKKEEPISEGFEKVFDKYSDDIESSYPNGMFDRGDIFRACEFGAKWQRQQDNNDANHALVEQIKTQQMCYEKGMATMKQQMMAKAVESGCFSYKNGFVHISCDIDEHLTDIKIGDKVKVIVIKED